MIGGTTESGVRYAVKQGGKAVAYCSLSLRCGTRNEEGFHNGIAHFTEHTIFKGTAKKTARTINGRLERLGGELNAYTTKEEIVIHATVLKEDLRKAVDLLLELATSASFPSKEVDTEKGVVIEEIQSYKDSPADDIFDRFEEKLFAGHPLGYPILGTAKSVKKIGHDELKSFAEKFFIPERMALSIVADIEEKKLEKIAQQICDRYFHGHAGVPAEPDCTPAGGVEISVFNETVDKHNHEVNAVIGSSAPSLYEEHERLTAVLLSNILGGPSSNSLLNSELREKNGWVYGVECSYTQYSDTGIMAIALGCDKENLDRCLSVVDKHLEALRTKELTPAKLKAAKKQLLGQLAVGSDNGETQCLSMGKSLLCFGRVSSDQENRKAIEAITAEDIKKTAQRIFDPSKLSRLIFL